MYDDPKQLIVIWTGIVCSILAIATLIVGVTWASNNYGNQLAKKCIDKGSSWVNVDRSSHQYECRTK